MESPLRRPLPNVFPKRSFGKQIVHATDLRLKPLLKILDRFDWVGWITPLPTRRRWGRAPLLGRGVFASPRGARGAIGARRGAGIGQGRGLGARLFRSRPSTQVLFLGRL